MGGRHSSSRKEPTRTISAWPDMAGMPGTTGPIVTPVSRVKQHDEPKHQREPIPHKLRDLVWTSYHGEKDSGVCYCCGAPIARYHGGWHCAHVRAEAKGGQTKLENLRPCCPHCNLSMGDQNLYVYIKEKGLRGPGAQSVNAYLMRHVSQVNDHRDNNWGKAIDAKKQPRARTKRIVI